jgi:SP family arabinose:H+ symporter-like MFS transporter
LNANPTLIASAIIAALGGFLFGFDTVVISGAEQKIQSVWGLSSFAHGLAMSAALWGTVLGSLVGAYPANKYGRKPTLLWIGILYFVSAVWSGLATDSISFMIARFIGGVGVGISTVAAPLYIAEISPPAIRGRLTAMYQFNIVLGILMAFLSNMALLGVSENDWRWMLGVEAFPALAYTLACLALSESPRWLVAVRNDRDAAAAVLKRLGASADEANAELEVIQTAAASESHHQSLLGAGLGKPILLTFLIAFFNQMSGINAILYFAPRIFELTGLEKNAAFLQSIGIGLTNLVFTFIGIALIDLLGRRTLLLIGSFGYIATLGMCSWSFASENYALVPYCLFGFIAAHAVGQGAVIWVFIAEIFPNRHRAAGASLGSATHWVFAALLTLVFPWLVEKFAPSAVFAFFTGMMTLQLVWVLTMVPETKGVPLEKLQKQLGLSAD